MEGGSILASIDFSKAFDTIPRDKLLEKLLDFGIDGKFFNMIKNSYYKLKTAMGESCRLRSNVTIHLFDTLIKPILIYMSDF